MIRNFCRLACVFAALSLLLAGPAYAEVSYNTAGSNYLQNFDSLSSAVGSSVPWTNDTTLSGWYWAGSLSDAANYVTPATYEVLDGTSASVNDMMSLGSDGNPDRALGSQNNNTPVVPILIGLEMKNATGGDLTSFDLTYTGEQWRKVANDLQDFYRFDYQVFDDGAGSLTEATGWTSVSALDFSAPIPSDGSSSGLDGNDPDNRDTLSATVGGLTWGDGQELWLRWSDETSVGGNRRFIMGLDDVSFIANASAIPEPSTFALSALGLLSLSAIGWRRRRRA